MCDADNARDRASQIHFRVEFDRSFVLPKRGPWEKGKTQVDGGGVQRISGLVQVQPGAKRSKASVVCDALLLDEESRSDTYPYMDIQEEDSSIGHEATVSKVADDQIFYLMSRGLSEEEAMAMIVRGFIEPIAKELPMEYAVELNRLIELQMEGSIG